MHASMVRRLSPLAMALCLAGNASSAVAQEGSPDAAQLQERIRSLETRLQTMEQAQARSSKDMAQVIDGVLRDAERRSQLLAAGRTDATAGYDRTFYIQSSDGAFALRPGILFQFRNITDFRSDARANDHDSTENGFEMRRMRLILGGTAFTPDLMYLIVWDTNRNTGNPLLLDAWVHYKLGGGFGIRAGQVLDPLSHETNTGPPRQLAVDDSAANELLCGGLTDRVQGVAVTYGQYQKENALNAELTFHDGGNSKNTDFRDTSIDPVSGADLRPDFGVAGRIEYKLMGDWKNYADFTPLGNTTDLLVAGAGFDVTGGSNLTSYLATADIQWETGSWGAYGALYVRHRDFRNLDVDNQTDWGAVVQGSYAMSSHLELFGRYDCVFFDSDFVAGQDTVHELTVGANYYLTTLLPHRGKITLDLSYLPNGIPSTLTGLGYIGGTGQAEWALRAQFQLAL